jgi:hypothetical protein
MACAICATRRPRRFCPGVRGDICSICCGTGREVTVNCPLDCEYLQDARRHEKPVPLDEAQVPNRDIKITDTFLRANEDLLVFLGRAVATAAFQTPGAVDLDVRDALAAHIFGAIQEGLAEFRSRETERLGMSKTRDSDVLGALVFLQRVELDRNNGRARGRAFLDALRGFYPPEEGTTAPPASSLILP